MNKERIFSLLFFVVVLAAITFKIILFTSDSSRTAEPVDINDTSSPSLSPKASSVSLPTEHTSSSQNIIPDTSPDQTPKIELSEDQQTKYHNLDDAARADMKQLLESTQEAQAFIEEKAEQYFEMLQDDEQLKALDNEVRKNINTLQQQLKNLDQE